MQSRHPKTECITVVAPRKLAWSYDKRSNITANSWMTRFKFTRNVNCEAELPAYYHYMTLALNTTSRRRLAEIDSDVKDPALN